MEDGFLHACASGTFTDVHAYATRETLAERDVNGNTPLHLAAMNGHKGICSYLVRERQCEFSATNTAGQTAWDLVRGKWNDLLGVLLPCDATTATPVPTSPNSVRRSKSRPRSSTAASLPADALIETGVARDADRELIRNAVNGLDVFHGFDQELFSDLIDAFEKAQVGPGEILIAQGEPTEVYYILSHGKVDITARIIHPTGADETLKTSLGSGSSIGDCPILYGCQTPYTATTATPCTLWFIREQHFDTFLMLVAEEENKAFLARAQLSKTKGKVGKDSNHQFPLLFSRLIEQIARRPSTSVNAGPSFLKMFRNRNTSNAPQVSPPQLLTQNPSRLSTKPSTRNRSISDPAKMDPVVASRRPEGDSEGFTPSLASSQVKEQSEKQDELPPVIETEDLVIKPFQDSKKSFVHSGTIKGLIEYMYNFTGSRDAEFTRYFLLTFRMYSSSEALFSQLLSAYQQEPKSSDLTLIQTNILTLLACWTNPLPRPFDPLLFENDPVLDKISTFADSVVDCPLRSAIKSNIRAGFKPLPPFKPTTAQSTKLWRITVHWIRRDDRTDSIDFDVTPDTTLQVLLERICKQVRDKARKQSSVESPYDMLMSPGSFQFISYGFCAPIKPTTVIGDAQLRQVSLVPVKAYSAGLCISKRIEPEYIAYLLSLLDFESFCRIDERELLRKSWQKSEESLAPHIRQITHRFNQFCSWIITTILLEKEEKERAAVIAKMIRIAEHFMSLHNMHGLFAVMSALGSVPISRLRKCWTFVEQREADKFKAMNAYISSENNRAAYRSFMAGFQFRYNDSQFALNSKSSVHCVLPYLGIILSDALFTEDGNQDNVNINSPKGKIPQINFIKFRRLGKILEELRAFQTTRFPRVKLEPSLPGSTLFNQQQATLDAAQGAEFLAKYQGYDEEEAWNRSVLHEPFQTKEESFHQKSRRAGGSRDFMWRVTIDDEEAGNGNGGNDDNVSILEANEPIEVTDDDSIFRCQKLLPSVSYIGWIEVKDEFRSKQYKIPDEVIEKCIKKIRKSTREGGLVSLDHRRERHMFVIVDEKKIAIITANFADVLHYEIYDKANVFYLVLPGAVDGHVIIHFFTAQMGARHNVAGFYLSFNAQAERWSKSSLSQSEAARQIAVKQLSGPSYLDGAFLLRDSTSRAGCYALSLKYEGEVTHYLLVSNEDGTVQVMDSKSKHPNLPALIFHHCLQSDGLPCVLRPEQCFILTPKCPYVNAEWFAEKQAQLERHKLPRSTLRAEHSPISIATSKEVLLPPPKEEKGGTGLEDQPWYMPTIDRTTAESMLAEAGNVEGMFLVRASSSEEGKYVLSLVFEGNLRHVLIVPSSEGVVINETLLPKMTILEGIIACHNPSQSIIPCYLRVPIKGKSLVQQQQQQQPQVPLVPQVPSTPRQTSAPTATSPVQMSPQFTISVPKQEITAPINDVEVTQQSDGSFEISL